MIDGLDYLCVAYIRRRRTKSRRSYIYRSRITHQMKSFHSRKSLMSGFANGLIAHCANCPILADCNTFSKDGRLLTGFGQARLNGTMEVCI